MTGTSPESVASVRALAAAIRPEARVSAYLLDRLVNEIEQGGAVRDLIETHPGAADSMVLLRAVAAVSRAHLAGRTPALTAHLDRLMAHDEPPGDPTWQLFREVLLNDHDGVQDALGRPVQQHEPDRAAQLLTGLGRLGAKRVRLLELGACAGLNLLVDRYHWTGAGWEWGSADSPVRLRASGPDPDDLTIVERAGCDLDPRDPADPETALTLCSFLPFEEPGRRTQLRLALRIAAGSGIRVDRSDAVEWLSAELARPAASDVTTVIWHSLFWLYLDRAAQDQLEDIIAAASKRQAIARISYEPPNWLLPPKLRLIYS